MPPMIQRLAPRKSNMRRNAMRAAFRAGSRSYVRDAFGRFARTGSSRGRQRARVLGRRARIGFKGTPGIRGMRSAVRRERSISRIDREFRRRGMSAGMRKQARRKGRQLWTAPPISPGSGGMFTTAGASSRRVRRAAMRGGRGLADSSFRGGASALRAGFRAGGAARRGGRGLADASFRGGASALRYGSSAARHGAKARGGVSRALGAAVRGTAGPSIASLRRNRAGRRAGRIEYNLIRSAGGGRRAARRVSKLQRGFVAGSIRTGGLKGGVKVPRRERRAQAAANAFRMRRDSPPLPSWGSRQR